MRETSRQQTPPPVAGREPEPPQGGEIRARWAWVEASVWTPRMLKALETGLEGGKWFRLIDKVWSETCKARSNKSSATTEAPEWMDEAWQQLKDRAKRIQKFARANGLTLHPEKTRIVNAGKPGGFDFLGYHFERRLRSILRKRRRGQDRGRGLDHQRWPNAFFHAQGLLSLMASYRAILQSP